MVSVKTSRQVLDVQRRLIESIHGPLIGDAGPFKRQTVVDALIICDGDISTFNRHYNEWRKVVGDYAGHDMDATFIHFIRVRRPSALIAPGERA
jgi:hypothetical protein